LSETEPIAPRITQQSDGPGITQQSKQLIVHHLGDGPDKMRTVWPISRSLSKRTSSGGLSCDRQRLDDARRHRYRLFGAHDQRGDAEGAVHATPAVSRKIKNKTNRAGKQRGQNGAQFACARENAIPLGQQQSRTGYASVVLRGVERSGPNATARKAGMASRLAVRPEPHAFPIAAILSARPRFGSTFISCFT
jgi:hypothetical protein